MARASCELRFRFTRGAVLHPKVVKQVLKAIEEAGQSTETEQ